MKENEIRGIIREMIEKKNDSELFEKLKFEVMSAFRPMAVPFTDKTQKPSFETALSSLENIIINFKKDNNLE